MKRKQIAFFNKFLLSSNIINKYFSSDQYALVKHHIDSYDDFFDKKEQIANQKLCDVRKTFEKYKWPTIDVTRKSVEETAVSIIKIYEISKENG